MMWEADDTHSGIGSHVVPASVEFTFLTLVRTVIATTLKKKILPN